MLYEAAMPEKSLRAKDQRGNRASLTRNQATGCTIPTARELKMALRGAVHLLIGFFLGYIVAAAAVTYLGDWVWSLPAALATVAVALS